MPKGSIELSIKNQWGDVDCEESEILTYITITNTSSPTHTSPLPIARKSDRVGLEYTAHMNGMEIAGTEEKAVALDERSTVIETSAVIDNKKIPAWWATHVNAGEETSLEIQPSLNVEMSLAEVSFQMPFWKKSIDTSIAEKLSTDEPTTEEAYGKEVMEIRSMNAEWGEADLHETPLDVTAQVYNPMTIPLVFTKIGYNVKMNGIELGTGETNNSIKVSSGEEREIETRAIFDNEQIKKWWVTHLQNYEHSKLEIEFTGKIEFMDYSHEFPIYSYNDDVETNILGFEETKSYGFL
ncbi:MAG: LEA type 2 family protein [Halobacteria archaeon]